MERVSGTRFQPSQAAAAPTGGRRSAQHLQSNGDVRSRLQLRQHRPSLKRAIMAKNQHHFHETAIREYDIRGVVGRSLSADDAYAVGRGFATILRAAGGGRAAGGDDVGLSLSP